MTIASMEQLEAMRPGSAVKVNTRRLGNRTFTRTEDGFEFDGTVVDLRFFAGHVAAGQVSDFNSGDPEPGDMFRSGRRLYLIASVEDGVAWIMQFTGDGAYQDMIFRTMDSTRSLTWGKVPPEQHPDWHSRAYAMGVQMRAWRAEHERTTQRLNETSQALNVANRDLIRMREARAAQIQVVATGVTRLPIEKATGQVPDKVTVVDVLASWRREFTVTTAPAPGCQCGTISREKVIELLGIEGQSEHADFGFQVDCRRH